MPTFEHEINLDLSAAEFWDVFKDQNTILPKIMPEAVASIVLEGEPGVEASRTVTFGPVATKVTHVKEKLVSMDIEGHTVVSEEVEGGHLELFGFTKWVQTLKLISTGENTSKLLITAEYEGGSEEGIAKSDEVTKKGLTDTFKALEQYKKSSA
ncbi:hypothetical protein R1flu_027102 [Riccia fluitans]|uniref:Bet v I/Major latex protein domain-containing protein n=1 Tax=Riccia fluitans TaxID=41844 RepID=A0ABD1XHU7_9MARC